MAPRSAAQRRAAALSATVVIAFCAVVVRFWRLRWGMGSVRTVFPDEVHHWGHLSDRFVPLTWSSFLVDNLYYPPLYGYLAGLATALASTLGLGGSSPSGILTGILIARVISASVSVITVAIVGETARRMYGSRVGLAAAALIAVAPMEAMKVHYASVDALLTAAVALTLLASYTAAVRATAATAAVAGMAAGVACATKYTGIAMVIPVIWAWLEALAKDRSALQAAYRAVAALGGFAVVFLLGCPPCILQFDVLLESLEWLRSRQTLMATFPWNFPRAWYGRGYFYQVVAVLPYSLGWPLYVLSLIGFGIAVRRHGVAERLLLVTVVPSLLLIGSFSYTHPYYVLLLFPPLVILAGKAVACGGTWRRARGLAFAFAWIYCLLLTLTQVARFSHGQQAAIARWIASAASSGADPDRPVRVGVPERFLNYWRICPAIEDAGLECVPVDWQTLRGLDLDAFVLPDWMEMRIRRRPPHDPKVLSLDQLTSGAVGYRKAARWQSWYLQRNLYGWLDPRFNGLLWQGEMNYTVYLPDGAPGAPAPSR